MLRSSLGCGVAQLGCSVAQSVQHSSVGCCVAHFGAAQIRRVRRSSVNSVSTCCTAGPGLIPVPLRQPLFGRRTATDASSRAVKSEKAKSYGAPPFGRRGPRTIRNTDGTVCGIRYISGSGLAKLYHLPQEVGGGGCILTFVLHYLYGF